MTSPLIDRLIEVRGYPDADADNLDGLVAGNEHLVLFFPGNPERYPESDDVAVILPELIDAFAGKLGAAVVRVDNEPALKQRYPFNVWPSLVFLRRGVQLGTISKVRDWADYIEQINALLAAQTRPEAVIPSIAL